MAVPVSLPSPPLRWPDARRSTRLGREPDQLRGQRLPGGLRAGGQARPVGVEARGRRLPPLSAPGVARREQQGRPSSRRMNRP